MRRSYSTRLNSAAFLASGMGVLLAMGCSGGQQSGVPNPFFSADRVPPPATRVIPQGTAQPYYSTQPMPAIQGGPPPAATPWTGAGQSDITPIPGNTFTSSSSQNSESSSRSLASEPSIAVPTDGADLRFASAPAPATRVDVAPLAGASAPAVTGTLPPRGTTTAATPLATSPTSIATTPAVANNAAATGGPQVTLTPVQNPAPESTFRDPSVPASSGAAAPQLFPNDVPRIRLPQGAQSPTEPVAVPSGVQTMSYQIELPPAGGVQAQPTTNVTPPAMYPAPPAQGAAPYGTSSGVVPAVYSTQVPQPPIAPDGFQPRGEARRRAEQQAPQQSSAVVPAAFASATLPNTGQEAYGYGASYEWLQGRLEYSAILGHWTLRYMPIGGPSDAFGGSVAITNSEALAGYRPGDFVTMQGQLVANGADPSLPVAYSVYTIQRQ